MALVTNIVIDLASQTANLTCMVGSDLVENITYDNITKQTTFLERAELHITSSEFLDYVNQIGVFETAVVFNFNPDQSSTTPFDKIVVDEYHDIGVETWSLTVTPFTGSNCFEYVATLSGFDMLFAKRNDPKTISFPEWLKCIIALNHYRNSVRNYFNT